MTPEIERATPVIGTDRRNTTGSGLAALGLCVVALIALLAFLAFLWWHPQSSCCCCCQPQGKAATASFWPAAPRIPPGTYAPALQPSGHTQALPPVGADAEPMAVSVAPVTVSAPPSGTGGGDYYTAPDVYVYDLLAGTPAWAMPPDVPAGAIHVPEPSAWPMFASGVALIALLARGRK